MYFNTDSTQVNIFVVLDRRDQEEPVALLLERQQLGISSLNFQSSPDEDGEIVDTVRPEMQQIIDLLQDRLTSGGVRASRTEPV